MQKSSGVEIAGNSWRRAKSMGIALIKVEPGGGPYPPPLDPPITVLLWVVPLAPCYKHNNLAFVSLC